MDGFNSREFYGLSLSEDPKLRTTTRNYEFKFNSPDHLERIISRVRNERETRREIELNANNTGRSEIHNYFSKTIKTQVKKIPTPTPVETQIGISSKDREAVVKIMSEEEIDEMLSQALQSTSKNLSDFEELKSPKDVTPLRELKKPREVKANGNFPQISVEVFPDPQPQWVEIKPVQKSIASLIEIPVDSYNGEDLLDSEEDFSGLNLAAKTPRRNETVISKNHYLDSLSFGSGMTEDFVIRNQESAFENDGNGVVGRSGSSIDRESPPESPVSLDIESSLNESEHLEMERVFEKVIPYVPRNQFKNLESEEKIESFEYSDEEYEKEDINFGDQDFDEGVSAKCLITTEEPKVQVQKTKLELKPIQNLSFRSANSSAPNTGRSVKDTSKPQPKKAENLPSNRRTTMAPEEIRSNILIEDLKKEKLGIFSKMTSIQEKMIQCLDELRISLVEISLPDGEIEQKLRERNALEFSVRFSRNYLFPLGKMIDDFRASPKEEYCSALTNEPCVKVCGIYGLLNQAIQCYQKQLRHFFTDSVPKKLDTLLNLIKDTTNICLEKQIFDKRDTLIQELVSRCEMFLGFVLEFAERKKSVRSGEFALQSGSRSRFKLSKTSSKWDLTMNLNNLNMYEPKLVQKKPRKTPQKKTIKLDSQRCTPKTKKTKKLIPKDSVDHVTPLAIDDLVETQVRKDNNVDSVQLINDVIAEEPDSDLAKAVIETLQDITKDEVHQMFGSIVLNLDSILKSSDNPQTAVESVLNVLKSKIQEAKGKRLKIDEIATENNTQNSNSNQKGVTKKGTHSGKEGKQQKLQQQQQKFKETRQTRVSKAKARVANCSGKNAKEDSTEQTERYSRSELTDTTNGKGNGKTNAICDKQSLRNIDDDDDVAVEAAFDSENENNSMKQKTCGGAFLSTSTTTTTTTAKKPTPAPDTKEVGGIAAAAAAPQPLSTSILPVKLDDVMPPPTPARDSMTSEQCLDYSTPVPVPVSVGLPRCRSDRFVSKTESHKIIGDGKHGLKEDAAAQRNVRDGAANAIDRAEDNQEAWRKNLPVATASTSSPVRNESTKSKSGEMEKLYYRKNALYTFVKYLENGPPPESENTVKLNINSNNVKVSCEIKTQTEDDFVKSPKEDCFETPKDILADISEQEEETRNDIDIKALLEERSEFIERCKKDPFYTNPQFPQPWKVLSKISKVIAGEIIENFENDLSFGEESFIRDFIDMEMQT